MAERTEQTNPTETSTNVNNGPLALLGKTPKKPPKKNGKTTRKKNIFDKELQLISTSHI